MRLRAPSKGCALYLALARAGACARAHDLALIHDRYELIESQQLVYGFYMYTRLYIYIYIYIWGGTIYIYIFLHIYIYTYMYVNISGAVARSPKPSTLP